jgi:hypothetical protein
MNKVVIGFVTLLASSGVVAAQTPAAPPPTALQRLQFMQQICDAALRGSGVQVMTQCTYFIGEFQQAANAEALAAAKAPPTLPVPQADKPKDDDKPK